jgi:uncharacterized protein involved in type VI secretion and phage assembly
MVSSFASLDSPLGSDLRFLHLSAQEAISEPFTYNVTALSRRADIDFKRLLGERVTVTLHVASPAGAPARVFDGFVQQVPACRAGVMGPARPTKARSWRTSPTPRPIWRLAKR